MKYRKKPVEVDAVKNDGTARTVKALNDLGCTPELREGENALYITTLEGVMRADVGDYIIKGVAGEFYPVKPDIFRETYEAVPKAVTPPPHGSRMVY